jgi:hypothetical protein
MCIGAGCDFLISDYPIQEALCQEIKQQYLSFPLNDDVTLSAAQCIKVKPKESAQKEIG